MKIRSKALHTYLLQTGAFNSTPEAITLAKREYRRQYKKQWRQQQRQQRKELRITFAHSQFDAITIKAAQQHVKRTVYVRSIVLQAAGIAGSSISKDQLQQVLQLVSMAVVGIVKRTHSKQHIVELLEQVEKLLLSYLSKHEP